ncbi:thioredoxin reductase [Candidatus Woesearchaeota archaeon CG10_big_fil_rev_8_21_14_0_10_45_5]|nr:MAG: thioredoxin reductase [Candidatus Woesearchaeota archaeon CG10_big_fil_rev_8_21_14_0_10_45_5]
MDMKIFNLGKNTAEKEQEAEPEKQAEPEPYDLIIIGGGPGGYSAAIYAARYNLRSVVLAKELGAIAEAPEIENYPGIESVSGLELMQRFQKHAEKLGIETKYVDVTDIKKGFTLFNVTDSEENVYKGKAILLATGTEKRRLDIENEKNYEGRGISYCATCDAAFYKDKVAAVLGGNDTAARYALVLAEFASKVYIIYRGEKIRAEPMLLENVKNNPKIEIITNDIVIKIKGGEKVEGAILKSGKELAVDGIFVAIGAVPNSRLAGKLGIALDEQGYIKVDASQQTSLPGVFAVGDVTNFGVKQVITAAAQGAVAAHFINDILKERKEE